MGNSFTTTTATAPTDLTTLTSLKLFLGISGSTDDTLLGELIDAVSGRIETLANRTFAATDYHEWYSIGSQPMLVLRQWPLIEVDRIATGTGNALAVAYSGSAIRATVSVSDTAVRLVSYSTAGAKTENSLTFATNGSASALKTAIDAVSGWTATVLNNVPSKDLHRVGGQDAKAETVTLTYADDDDCEYQVDYQRGIVTIDRHFVVPSAVYGRGFHDGPQHFPRGSRNVLVEYRAGFETIPAEIQQIANELAAQAYRAAKRDSTLSSESLGDYSYTLADQTVVTQHMMQRISMYSEVY